MSSKLGLILLMIFVTAKKNLSVYILPFFMAYVYKYIGCSLCIRDYRLSEKKNNKNKGPNLFDFFNRNFSFVFFKYSNLSVHSFVMFLI